MVNFEITEKCSLRCPCCYKTYNRTKEISFNTLIELLNEAAEMGTKRVQFSGGDPLLYTRLEDVIQYAKHLGLETRISTSGVVLDDAYISALKEAGLDYCHISLNGSTKEIHNLTREGFNGSLNAIKLLKSHGLKCIINWIASRENIKDLDNLVLLGRKYGVISIDIIMMKMNNKNDTMGIYKLNELNYLKKVYQKNRDIMNIEPCFSFLRLLIEKKYMPKIDKGCGAGRFTMAVNTQGHFLPCAHLMHYAVKCVSMKDYWESDEILLKLRYLSKEENMIDQCNDCSLKKFCIPCYALDDKRMSNMNSMGNICFIKNSV